MWLAYSPLPARAKTLPPVLFMVRYTLTKALRTALLSLDQWSTNSPPTGYVFGTNLRFLKTKPPT